MCQENQTVTFHCGHQIKFWWGPARFCLFIKVGEECFHTTYDMFQHIDDPCPRCKIGDLIKQKGKVMKRADFAQTVQTQYSKTKDWREEVEAKRWQLKAQTALKNLTSDKVAELEIQIRHKIVFHLSKNLSPSSKAQLLGTITRLPDVFGRRALVEFFGSRYFDVEDKARTLRDWEHRKLFGVARRAGLEKTLKTALSMTEPVPLPAYEKDPDVKKEDGVEDVQQGMKGMALTS